MLQEVVPRPFAPAAAAVEAAALALHPELVQVVELPVRRLRAEHALFDHKLPAHTLGGERRRGGRAKKSEKGVARRNTRGSETRARAARWDQALDGRLALPWDQPLWDIAVTR